MNRNSAMFVSLALLAACSVVDPRRASLDFNALHGDMTEAQAMALNSRLEWRCTDDTQYHRAFGQRMCDGLFETLNSVPGTHIDYMFRDGHLSAALIEYSPDAFKALRPSLDANMGQGGDQVPRTPANAAFGPGAELMAWKAKGGTVISSRKGRNANGNVFVAWISSQELKRYVGQ